MKTVRKLRMRGRIKTFGIGLVASTIIILSVASTLYGADITVAWDANCNENPDLIGYNIYYKAGSSVLADPQNADVIYIPLSDAGFNEAQPSYQITDLLNDVRYYFTVTAIYSNDQIEDEESAMSNEVSTGDNGNDTAISDGSSNSDSSGSSDSAGCFISDLLPWR